MESIVSLLDLQIVGPLVSIKHLVLSLLNPLGATPYT